MPVEIGQLLDGKYRIVRVLGSGGMGVVYEGENVNIRRRVAVKVLEAEAARDAELVKRFEREAQAAGRIGNDHIVEILDLGALPHGDRFIVMEYLDGESLHARLQRVGRLAPLDASAIAMQVLAGLADAHRAQIVHRDLKPENIFILREKAGHTDFVKIIDFGISKFDAGMQDMRMTKSGAVMGTPYYMSPEQASGSPVDALTDLYAVGVILFEMASGTKPFVCTSYNRLMMKIAMEGCPPLAATMPDLPASFCRLVDKAVCRNPRGRFQSAAEFSNALKTWLADGTARQALPSAGGESFGKTEVASAPRWSRTDAVPIDTPAGAGWANYPSPPRPSRSHAGSRSQLKWFAVAAAVVAACVGAIAIAYVTSGDAPSSAATAVQVPVPGHTSSPPSAEVAPKIEKPALQPPIEFEDADARAYIVKTPPALPPPSEVPMVRRTPDDSLPRRTSPRRAPAATPPAPSKEPNLDLGY